MRGKLVSVEHTHNVKITEKELDALLLDGYDRAIDGIKVAEHRWVNLWSDVDADAYVDDLLEEGYGSTDVLEAALKQRQMTCEGDQ